MIAFSGVAERRDDVLELAGVDLLGPRRESPRPHPLVGVRTEGDTSGRRIDPPVPGAVGALFCLPRLRVTLRVERLAVLRAVWSAQLDVVCGLAVAEPPRPDGHRSSSGSRPPTPTDGRCVGEQEGLIDTEVDDARGLYAYVNGRRAV